MSDVVLYQEEPLAQRVRSLLRGYHSGEVIPYVPYGRERNDAFTIDGCLESFIPDIINEIHPEFGGGVDGVYSLEVKKTGPLQMSYIGWILFVPSYFAALHLEVRVARHKDLIEWCFCQVAGQDSRGNAIFHAYDTSRTSKVAQTVINSWQRMRWRWSVEYGERQPSSESEES